MKFYRLGISLESGDCSKFTTATSTARVVLDDADAPGVHAFFDILGTQRKQEWDPLLIVTASSRRYSTSADQNPEEWPARRADEARYTDWIENRNRNAGWGPSGRRS